jgi:REP element-mobilizing transposase RayT/disulfide oxidoreductase YuzD
MPENRKYYPHNAVLLVTSRTEEGLPIVPTLIMNFLIWGILARARTMYRVKVCHFLFMANHFHMILVVDNPEHVSEFIGYVKAETAHAINKLLGRRKKRIWDDGYDSPMILTLEDVLKYIRYIYLNPARANLVESIKDYPGVSSWQMFVTSTVKSKHKRQHRSSIKAFSIPALSINEQKEYLKILEGRKYPEYEFILEPFAWVECFTELKNENLEKIKNDLISDIHKEELRLSKLRKEQGKEVIGSTILRRQSMAREYQPTKFSRRMICLCSEKELRKAFIATFRDLCDKARKIYQLWKRGEVHLKIPPGLFAPRVPNLVSAISVFS